MGTYSADRDFTDRFDPELKRIIGALAVGTASPRQDRHQATDFVVHQVANLCYASRVRRRDRNFILYSDEFTIRSRRDNGVTTEFAKILAGWGDRLLYGWGNDSDSAGAPGSVFPWAVINLDALRKLHHVLFSGEKPNRDVNGRLDGTWFRYFYLRDAARFPDFIVKSAPEIIPWREVVIHELQCWYCGRRWDAPGVPTEIKETPG